MEQKIKHAGRTETDNKAAESEKEEEEEECAESGIER